MKYLLLAYGNEEKFNRLSEDEMTTLIDQCTAYDEELRATGRMIGGGSLSWDAKTLRLNGGKLSVTDGPYVETKEVVGGLVFLEAADWDEAVRLASLHPAARMGEELGWAIELRPMEQCILKALTANGSGATPADCPYGRLHESNGLCRSKPEPARHSYGAELRVGSGGH